LPKVAKSCQKNSYKNISPDLSGTLEKNLIF